MFILVNKYSAKCVIDCMYPIIYADIINILYIDIYGFISKYEIQNFVNFADNYLLFIVRLIYQVSTAGSCIWG